MGPRTVADAGTRCMQALGWAKRFRDKLKNMLWFGGAGGGLGRQTDLSSQLADAGFDGERLGYNLLSLKQLYVHHIHSFLTTSGRSRTWLGHQASLFPAQLVEI
jgi:hypothetical protein